MAEAFVGRAEERSAAHRALRGVVVGDGVVEDEQLVDAAAAKGMAAFVDDAAPAAGELGN